MPECTRCDRWFKTERALVQHKEDSPNHHICDDCNKDFATSTALIQHYTQSPRHPYCSRCDEHFDDWEDLHEHYEEEHYYCDDCNLIFDCELGLHKHRHQKHADVYCVPCKRMFKNNNALRNHQRSTLHQGRTIDCPMKNCSKSFVSRAALVLHLESGACPSSMTRDMVNRIMAKLDKKGVITNPARLLEYEGEAVVTAVWATDRAWNGSQYECYLCHRTFATLPALNQHLSSPAHAEKFYRCPVAWHGCETKFRTFSGFCQHVESEQCGVHRFKKTMDNFIDRIPKGKRLVG